MKILRTSEQRHAEYLRTKKKCLARAKSWTENNPEKRKLILKKWNNKAKDYKRNWAQKKNFNTVIKLIKCYLCSSNNKLVVHHKDGNNGKMNKSLNNNFDNLIVLCRSCHAKVHTHGKIKVML